MSIRASLLLLLGIFIPVCSDPAPHTVIPENPDVILITVDTLRADHLSGYGYQGIETPGIDSLARDGLLFEQAVTPVPITLPAHASILTGLYPFSHGIRDNSGPALSPEARTLAELLKDERQYKTGAFVGAFVLDSRFGLDQGFDTYLDDFESGTLELVSLQISEHRAEEVLSRARKWIDRSHASTFFCWIHLFDPHAPYDPPEGFRRPDIHPYDAEILYADRQLGRFFRYLKDRNLYDESLILLTSDHGEGLGEHREDTHGMFLYDSTVHVPLIVKLPGNRYAGTRWAELVRLIDLKPTIQSILGLEPSPGIQGRDFSGVWRQENTGGPRPDAYLETLLPHLNYGWRGLRGLRSGNFKLIDGAQPELYHLTEDPGEKSNLAARESARLQDLKRRLTTLVDDPAAVRLNPGPITADPQALERLRSLGYLGGAGGTGADPFSDSLANPAEKIGLFNRVWQAQDLTVRGKYRESVRILDEILAEDQTLFLAHSIQALNYIQLNRPERAIPHLEQAVRLRPDDAGSRFYLGIAHLRMGDLSRASVEFETTLKIDPQHLAALNNLGTVYIRLGETVRATRVFEKLLTEDDQDAAAWSNLGVLRMQSGDWDSALDTFNQALDLNPGIPEIYNNIGLIHLNRGRYDLAISNFRKALELRPDYPTARRNLEQALQARRSR